MPASTIHDDYSMSIRWRSGREQGQVLFHGLLVGHWAEQGFRLSRGRTDGTKQIGILELLLAHCPWSGPLPGPQSGRSVLLAKAGLILKPDVNVFRRDVSRYIQERFLCEVFLNACCA